MDIESLRHEKEKTYQSIMLIVGGIAWLIILVVTVGLVLLYLAMMAFGLWLTSLFFKAIIYGDSVKVTAKQYPELHKILVEQSQTLGLPSTPEMFIYNGNGIINAVAVKFLSTKYVILMSNLVDLMLKRGKTDELAMIIGHELAHHAVGHTNVWRNLLMGPARIIPLLGAAYNRSRELTADRIGFAVTGNLSASQNALIAVAIGSESLGNNTDIAEFVAQEQEIPEFMGFLHKIFSSYPRMTRRVIELSNFHGRGSNYIA